MRALPLLLALAVALAAIAGCSDPPAAPPASDGPAPAGTQRAPGLPPAAPSVEAFPGGPLVVDPTAPGPLASTRVPYDFGVMMAQAPNGVPPQYPVQVRGELTVPEGAGPYPLAVFLHGRHGTCDIAGIEVLGAYACPNAVVVTPVDSHQGYRPMADLLASHGYIVASIDANQINERDQGTSVGAMDYGALARAGLALRTIQDLADVNASGVAGMPEQRLEVLRGRIDLSRIGLMGHSRGGEGMARAVVVNNEGAQVPGIRALFALAPTDFAHWTPTGVAFATLLPYCDGDVSTLQGSWMFDDLRDEAAAGALHQVLSMGADHNFYNDRWTGDDWGARDDDWCDRPGGDGRDEPGAQMAQGAAVLSSFFRMAIGGEAGFEAYWTGEVPFPDAACGQPCAPRLLVSRHGTPAQRVILSRDGFGSPSGGVQAAQCVPGTSPADTDCRAGTIGTAARTNVSWSQDGGLAFDVPAGLPQVGVLTFRIATHATSSPTLEVRFLDAQGDLLASTPVRGQPVEPSPGKAAKKLVLSMVRVPLGDVDLARLATVDLRFAGSGEAQLADVLLQREDVVV